MSLDLVDKPRTGSVWTEEAVAKLKSLWDDGQSASTIGAALGMSRNSVLGKVHRLGLSTRVVRVRTAPAKPREMRKPSAPTLERAPRLMPLPAPLPVRLEGVEDGRITVFHLTDKTCKWPIGDPSHKDFRFCGHGPREGSPYCEYHARVAYEPAHVRQRENRYAAAAQARTRFKRNWGGV